MIEITETKIRNWADKLKIENLVLAEQDFRLTQTLKDIYSNVFLKERIYLKGGTAINKFYFGKTSRLSIDLDFNAIGEKESLLKERKEMENNIISILKEEDSSYIFKIKRKYELLTITVYYKPIFGVKQKIKIEISTIERVPILGKRERGRDFSVNTYTIEEILATKIRAVFERLKGRDIYDLHLASFFDLNKKLLRKLVLYYFYRSGKVFNPKIFFKNIEEKFLSKRHIDDVSVFIRGDVKFSMEKAMERILKFYSFLGNLDENDEKFLVLAKTMLGEEVGKKKQLVKDIKHPLALLFKNLPITERAKKMNLQEFKIFRKR